MYVTINMRDIFIKQIELDTNKNLIVVHVQNDIIESGNTDLEQLIDVAAHVETQGIKESDVDIRDVIIKNTSSNDVILHYIVYDLWVFDQTSKINLKIEAFDGKFKGFVSAEIIDMSPFSIQWIDKQSDTFIPREQHTACETWDGTVWVFGGKRNEGKKEVLMNDVMSFDSKQKFWNKIQPTTSSVPKERFGHSMVWYFNYLVVFGGQDKDGKSLGDLWVFDIIKAQWKFIMDSADTFEIGRMGVEGIVPASRRFTGAISVPELSGAVFIGGLMDEGVAWDIWNLRLDRLILFIEDKYKFKISNFWERKTIPEEYTQFLCRSGHSVAMIDTHTMLIYGGIDDSNKFSKTPITYNILTNKIVKLKEPEVVPDPIMKSGMLPAGNKMVIMYGGVKLNGVGFYTDLWHMTVVNDTINYQKVPYKNNGAKLFMTWRHGFTMHYVRNIQDPILIGGTFGNNQQAKALVILPEKKCNSEVEFKGGECSPCPIGSIINGDKCKWWGHSQYFHENQNNYFDSKCFDCPRGLVGGIYRSWAPWNGGFIYDMTSQSFWHKCDDDKIWPIGTKFEFPVTDFSDNFEEVRQDHLPDVFNPHKQPFDHTATIVIFICVLSTLILFIIIAIVLSMWKGQSLFIWREIDKTFITGGKMRSVVGGIIMWFFILITFIVSAGFIINFFIFNSKTVVSETKNPFLNRSYPSSYFFNVTLYTSRFIDSEDPFEVSVNNFQSLKTDPMPDLWKTNKTSYSMSRYFGQVKDSNKIYSCTRKQLSNGTDAYILSLLIKDVEDDAPEQAYVRFLVDSDYNQVFHFFKWEYWNVWKFYDTIPTSYSKLSGFVSPQLMHRSNKNITSAFKGPESTKIFYKLIPTHYGNEIESQNFEGYEVIVEEYQRGSVVNKGTMANKELISGEINAGFDLELVSSVGDTMYHVHVQRVKSIIEVIAYIFGFMAGFIIIAHLLKYFLSKEEYFRALDREWNTLFGSLEAIPSTQIIYKSNVQARDFEMAQLNEESMRRRPHHENQEIDG